MANARDAVLAVVATLALLAPTAAPVAATTTSTPPCPHTPTLQLSPASPINHLIIIYMENWSFDSLYGLFPGANGIANAGAAVRQVDRNGLPYATLPQPLIRGTPDNRFPANLPVEPFDAARYVPADQKTGDPLHRFYQHQYQVDGGKMDQFVAWSNTGGLAMSYYDATKLPLGQLALQYTLADNFFQAAFGGSILNQMWLICSCTPTWPDAPDQYRVQLDERGTMAKDGVVTPDGYIVNNPPPPVTAGGPVPLQSMPTIGDRLIERGVSWTWYGLKNGTAFGYFAGTTWGTPAFQAHLKPSELEFKDDLQNRRLAAVSWIWPEGHDAHPGSTALLPSEQYIAELIAAVRDSPYWADTAIIITYDEYGGRWDHVPPPVVDRWGPGTRVPAIIISPHARKGFVDHTQYDTTSILKFIEWRWSLTPVTTRDVARLRIGE